MCQGFCLRPQSELITRRQWESPREAQADTRRAVHKDNRMREIPLWIATCLVAWPIARLPDGSEKRMYCLFVAQADVIQPIVSRLSPSASFQPSGRIVSLKVVTESVKEHVFK